MVILYHTALCSVFLLAGVWSVQPTTGKKPPPMSHHTFTKIDHHRAVVIAGVTGWVLLNNTYVLDMQTWVWNNYVHVHIVGYTCYEASICIR